MQRLAKILKQLRKQAGMTQKQLAAKSGITQISVSRLERGENSYIFTLIAALRVFGYNLTVAPRKTQGGPISAQENGEEHKEGGENELADNSF